MRSVTVTIDDVMYFGTYYVQNSVVYVQSEFGSRTTQIEGSPARAIAKLQMTVDSDLRATAYYESGLAVVAWSLNLRVRNVSIRADNVRAGETNTDPANHLPIEDQLAILVAGREAAHIFDAQAHPSTSHTDMERQFELLNGRPEQEQFALIHEAHERARRRLIEHKPKVALLAERLVAAALNVDDSEFLRLMQSHPIANV